MVALVDSIFVQVMIYYLKPNQTYWINGGPENMHLAEQGISRGGIVLSWAFGDKNLGVRLTAVLVVFRGI